MAVRFGFKTSPQDTTWDAMAEVWRAADDIDVFESGWTSDHFYPLHGADPSGPRLEGWVTLAALAQATIPAVLEPLASALSALRGG